MFTLVIHSKLTHTPPSGCGDGDDTEIKFAVTASIEADRLTYSERIVGDEATVAANISGFDTKGKTPAKIAEAIANSIWQTNFTRLTVTLTPSVRRGQMATPTAFVKVRASETGEPLSSWNVGEYVVLGKHEDIPGRGRAWAADMDKYVGRVAKITEVEKRSSDELIYCHVDLDEGYHRVWRVANMTKPTPAQIAAADTERLIADLVKGKSTTPVTASKPTWSTIKVGDPVILGKHTDPGDGSGKDWSGSMEPFVGRAATVTERYSGSAGGEVKVDIDLGRHHWRVRDMLAATPEAAAASATNAKLEASLADLSAKLEARGRENGELTRKLATFEDNMRRTLSLMSDLIANFRNEESRRTDGLNVRLDKFATTLGDIKATVDNLDDDSDEDDDPIAKLDRDDKRPDATLPPLLAKILGDIPRLTGRVPPPPAAPSRSGLEAFLRTLHARGLDPLAELLGTGAKRLDLGGGLTGMAIKMEDLHKRLLQIEEVGGPDARRAVEELLAKAIVR